MTTIIVSFVLVALAQPVTSTDDVATERIEIAEALVKKFAAGKFEEAGESYDDTMREAFPAEKMKQVWQGIIAQTGAFQKVVSSRSEPSKPYHFVFVTVRFDHDQLDTKVVFDDKNQIAGLFFVPLGEYHAPDYVDEASFTEEEITIGKGLFSLPGTLTLPNGDGPFPAAVLVHGSGPQDRDETIGPNKPFRDLAHGLASQGIAVVRYEKRTHHHKIQMALYATTITVKIETVDDAAAAVEAAATHDKIDAKRVFICGHSLGGYLIPRMARASERSAGFVSLAGSARPLEDLILDQNQYMHGLDGKVTEEEEQRYKELEKLAEKIRAIKPGASAFESIFGAPASYWIDLHGYDPAEEARQIDRPMFFLQGDRDFQVTEADFGRWKTVLGDRPHVTFREYATLNHLLIAGEGNSSLAEYSIPGNVAEDVVRDVAQWIKKQPKQG